MSALSFEARNFAAYLLHLLLSQVTAIVTSNLNKIIDVNYYPVETAKTSNLRHRPIGIGVQGLADTFILLGMSFDSPEVIAAFQDVLFHPLSTELVVISDWILVYTGSTAEQRHF